MAVPQSRIMRIGRWLSRWGLLCKNEDLSLNPWHSCEKPAMAGQSCNISAWGQRQADPESSLASQTSQKQQWISCSVRNPVSRQQNWEWQEDTQHPATASSGTCMGEYVHTHVHHIHATHTKIINSIKIKHSAYLISPMHETPGSTTSTKAWNLGMVAHTHNTNTWEMKERELGVQGHPWMPRDIKASLS